MLQVRLMLYSNHIWNTAQSLNYYTLLIELEVFLWPEHYVAWFCLPIFFAGWVEKGKRHIHSISSCRTVIGIHRRNIELVRAGFLFQSGKYRQTRVELKPKWCETSKYIA